MPYRNFQEQSCQLCENIIVNIYIHENTSAMNNKKVAILIIRMLFVFFRPAMEQRKANGVEEVVMVAAQ